MKYITLKQIIVSSVFCTKISALFLLSESLTLCSFENVFDFIHRLIILNSTKIFCLFRCAYTPQHLSVVAIEKGTFGSTSTMVANFTFLYTTIISMPIDPFIYLFLFFLFSYLHSFTCQTGNILFPRHRDILAQRSNVFARFRPSKLLHLMHEPFFRVM